jgi:peptidoglycan/xylan/chitin deacetylase (PgdA/CDA1 family)
MYHRLTAQTGAHPLSLATGRFRRQLALLRSLGYRSLSPLALADRVRRGQPAPPRSVVITFDDGYLDTLTVALPALREFGFTATCYIVPGAVGGASTWTERAPLMDWAGVQAWRAAGMEVGSHSLSHADLTRVDGARLRAEVADSKAWLEDRLGFGIDSFVYPFNRVDDRAIQAVEEAGYAAGGAGAEIRRSPYALTRVDAARDSWPRFGLQLLRAFPALRGVVRTVIPRRPPPTPEPTPLLR